MIANVRYGHTNLIAQDWRALASFYEELFGCIPVPPERDFKGSDLERGTGIPGAELRGVHLRLPGHGAAGPTPEVRSLVHAAFALRRKTLVNALVAAGANKQQALDTLATLGLASTVRAQELAPDVFPRLAAELAWTA